MAGGFKMAMGGLLEGVGRGAVMTGDYLRQEALQEARQRFAAQEREDRQAFDLERDATKRTQALEDRDAEWTREDANSLRDHQRAMARIGASKAPGPDRPTASERQTAHLAQLYAERAGRSEPNADDWFRAYGADEKAPAGFGAAAPVSSQDRAEMILDEIDKISAAQPKYGDRLPEAEIERLAVERVDRILGLVRDPDAGKLPRPPDYEAPGMGVRLPNARGDDGAASAPYASAEAVREAFRRGEIKEDEAMRILRDNFGME